MENPILKALCLIFRRDPELLNILTVTGKICTLSSLGALLLGASLGIFLGCASFPGKKLLVICNRTMMSIPPVVCGLIFYLLFSGVGPLGYFDLLFTPELVILAQIALLTPLVIGTLETAVTPVAPVIAENAKGIGLSGFQTVVLLAKECSYCVVSSWLLAFGRAISEVGAVSIVGGAIAWKTNVITTAIMQHTNRGNYSMAIALGIILMIVSLAVNAAFCIIQERLTK